MLATRRALNTDAFAPSIAVIGEQILVPGKSLDIFNPFTQFEARPCRLRDCVMISACCAKDSTPRQRDANRHRLPDDCDFVSSLAVSPHLCLERTRRCCLPVEGQSVLIWEGRDFYAHSACLRVPLGNPRMAAMGIAANSNEFANDFIYTDAEGNAYRGDPRNLANWHSYGKPIYAPGAGIVRESAGDIPDNQFANAAATSITYPHLPPGKDPQDLGNHVLIDHGNGVFSLLLHMKPGSVTVKAGDHVAQGQQIGAIGFTGDAIFPHLHYVLMEGPQTGKSWGLPAYFSRFRRYFGAASQEVSRDSTGQLPQRLCRERCKPLAARLSSPSANRDWSNRDEATAAASVHVAAIYCAPASLNFCACPARKWEARKDQQPSFQRLHQRGRRLGCPR